MSGSANLANYSVLVTSWLPEENLQLLISKPAEALTTTYKRLSSYTQINVVFSSLQGKFSMQQTETMTESHNQSKHQVVTCLFTFNLFFHFFFFLSFLQCFTSSFLLFFLSFFDTRSHVDQGGLVLWFPCLSFARAGVTCVFITLGCLHFLNEFLKHSIHHFNGVQPIFAD